MKLRSSRLVGSRLGHEGEETANEPRRKQRKLDHPLMENTRLKHNIGDLPDEVMVVILSFLSFSELVEVAQNVCAQWRRASHDPLLWRNKEYCVVAGKSDAEVLSTLTRVPQLRSLVMKCYVKAAILRAVCENCPHLTTLEVAYYQEISYRLLKKLVMSCQNIQYLRIPKSILVYKRNANILSKLEKLQSLEVMKGYQYNDTKSIHLAPLAHRCPQFSKLTVRPLVYIRHEDLNKFIEVKCKALTHLVLPWTDRNKRCVVPLLKDCTGLVNLELYDVSNTSGEFLQAFAALGHMSNLRSLNLEFSSPVAEQTALAFRTVGLLQLQVLKISGTYMQNSVLEGICVGCPNINELQLSDCRGLSDGNLKELHRLRNLETLALKTCRFLRAETLLHVAQVRKLRKLLLEGCNLYELYDGLPFILQIHTLEILSFAFTRCTSFFHFNWIPETLTNLRVLNVEGCVLDKSILQHLKNQMPGLQVYAPGNANRKSRSEFEEMMRL